MTTFLATGIYPDSDETEYTIPYCSHQCLEIDNFGIEIIESVWHSSYEFDETCANCGREIPASAENG